MKKILSVLASLLLAMMLAGCVPEGNDYTDEPEPEPLPEPIKYNVNPNPRRVYMEIWGEPWEDPRNAIGYELADSGVKFFDRYIVLYGGRLVWNDCPTTPMESGNKLDSCRRMGLHLHLSDDVTDIIWKNPNIYTEMKRAGIKYLMGLVPKDRGFAIGLSYEWPGGGDEAWEKIPGMPQPYPFKEAAVEELQRQILEERNRYGFDGVGYDEEYANHSGYKGQGGLGDVYVNLSGHGRNIFRFAYELQKKWPDVVQDVYEIRGGGYLPKEMVLDGKTVKVTDVFDLSYDSTYGGWRSDSNWNDREFYGPGSIDIASGLQARSLPESGQQGIQNSMWRHLDGNYGVVMFYCLRAHSTMRYLIPDYYGPENAPARPEFYLSQISKILFQEETVYNGKDYPLLGSVKSVPRDN